jgi:hypothetical protein
MITKRIATALKRQDWATFTIELILVIAGVLIALQLDQWNENRKDRALETTFLNTVADDVRRDVADIYESIRALTAITEFGRTALAALETDGCAERCWVKLVAFFHASQWIDVRPNRATYDEIKRTGLPRNQSLKERLTRYYEFSDQYNRVMYELPRYRELVRSVIPAAIQDYLWAECFKILGRKQTFVGDCEAPISEEQAATIIGDLQASDEARESLNFWLSTVSVVTRALPDQIVEAESVIVALSEYVESAE